MKLKFIILKIALLGSSCISTSIFGMAQDLVFNDETLRQDLNWLNQQGVIRISTSTWPLHASEIERCLNASSLSDPVQSNPAQSEADQLTITQIQVLQRVRDQLHKAQQHLSLNLHADTQNNPAPLTFAQHDQAQQLATVTVRANSASWSGRLQLNMEHHQRIPNGHNVNFEGSSVSFTGLNQQLIFGQIPSYWGPAHDGSLIRGSATRPVLGFTAQRVLHNELRSPWLSWIGPWQYQAFVGELRGQQSFAKTKLLGLRLSAQPFPNVEIGASRMLQWGGTGRPQNWSSLRKAVLGKDNQCEPNACHDVDNPANQLAGMDIRLNLHSLIRYPMSLYGQFVGEDEAGLWPAKKMYQLGVDYASQLSQHPYLLYLEWADTRSNGIARGISYQHHIYRSGYTQYTFPLGHAIGGDAVVYSSGGQFMLNPQHQIAARMLYAKLNSVDSIIHPAFSGHKQFKTLELSWRYEHTPAITVGMHAWLSDATQAQSRLGMGMTMNVLVDSWIFRK